MFGRFEKAPLVYVTAHVRLSRRPDLLEDQWTRLEQAMVLVGLKQFREKVGQRIELKGLPVKSRGAGEVNTSRLHHYGFFNSNFTEGFILGPDSIEYRTTDYHDYSLFRKRLLELLQATIEAANILGELDVSEVVLTYCDAIVPAYGRALRDYFSQPDSLPLNLLSGSHDDKSQVAQGQATRLISARQKVSVALEQVPVGNDGQVRKWLPNGLVEPSQEFAMPLAIRSEWAEPQRESHYALLTTEASQLVEEQSLNKAPVSEVIDCLHALTRDAFNEIIHTEHCRQDWGYTESH